MNQGSSDSATAYLPPLKYSNRVVRQLAGAPANDCGTHPKTDYRKVPRHLRDRVGFAYACGACLKELEAAVAAERKEERDADKAMAAQVKAQREQTKQRALDAQEALATMYSEASTWREDQAQRLADAEAECERVALAFTEATVDLQRKEKTMLAARQALAKSKAAWLKLEPAVSAAYAQRKVVEAEEPFALGHLKAAIDGFDVAWAFAPKKLKRKKMDRRLYRRAVKLLGSGELA